MEKHLNLKIRDLLKGLYPQRIENICAAGTPDIECCGTWIESKFIATTPRHTTTVKLSHFTTEQRLWHRLRRAIGDVSYVALLMGNSYYLFNGNEAALHLGIDWTVSDIEKNNLGLENLRAFIAHRLASVSDATTK